MSTPTPPAGSPCDPWEYTNLCACPAFEVTAPNALLNARRIATELLWELSGRRYGPSCPLTVYPCVRPCTGSGSLFYGAYGGLHPYIDDGVWRNAVCGCGADPCQSPPGTAVELEGPVYDVIDVSIDGVPFADANWRVDYNRAWLLVRTDGEPWPQGQGLTVTYRTGLNIGYLGQRGFDALVCKLLSECSPGSCGCKLPANTSRVSRQGVDIEMHDILEMRAAGLTGVAEADRWILAVNPFRQASPSRVYSVDGPRSRHRITPIL